ncbi:E3 ubiquitin-protein ligase RSL1-like [Magnolia sinica]|uniref:E3 ubiquitin-protein ligase RSL1-like n=1 Tax=Magnolia sinica TaxID=86752 RepID=UPI002657D856|nr:E3 ubiquitin-protein ligase RSL1-like [Magnolia sinica]
MEESSNSNTLLDVDDFYMALLSEEDLLPISDEKFAVELQLQEVILSSILSSLPRPSLETGIIPSEQNETTPTKSGILVKTETGESSSLPHPFLETAIVSSSVKNETTPTKSDTLVKTETGESSGSFCEICMETKPPLEMFENKNCSHVFCTNCISKHVEAKIQENRAMVICPGLECKGVLEPDLCRPIIPAQVHERWETALSELKVLGSQRFYCPFKDCSALLIDDGGDLVREAECPNCRRFFCAQCKVPWHSGVGCDEYQALNEDERGRDDLMVMELAKTSGWTRCSHCKYIVEKTEGCIHMTCRCGFQFCYRCGGAWSDTHASCNTE